MYPRCELRYINLHIFFKPSCFLTWTNNIVKTSNLLLNWLRENKQYRKYYSVEYSVENIRRENEQYETPAAQTHLYTSVGFVSFFCRYTRKFYFNLKKPYPPPPSPCVWTKMEMSVFCTPIQLNINCKRNTRHTMVCSNCIVSYTHIILYIPL